MHWQCFLYAYSIIIDMSLIEVKNVVYSYNDEIKAIDGVSFNIEKVHILLSSVTMVQVNQH